MRSADRTRELAIRLSIGFTRWRILWQFLSEALLISPAGGMVGTVLAQLLMQAISRWQPIPEYPIQVAVVPDPRVYVLAVVLALLSGLLPGLLSARQIWRTNTMQAIMSGTGGPGLLGVPASRVLASIVYQASPRDPLVLAGAVLTMAGVGLVATWLPARRAYRLHPAQLLREE